MPQPPGRGTGQPVHKINKLWISLLKKKPISTLATEARVIAERYGAELVEDADQKLLKRKLQARWERSPSNKYAWSWRLAKS